MALCESTSISPLSLRDQVTLPPSEVSGQEGRVAQVQCGFHHSVALVQRDGAIEVCSAGMHFLFMQVLLYLWEFLQVQIGYFSSRSVLHFALSDALLLLLQKMQ